MLTDLPFSSSTPSTNAEVLFLFAHQDDEFGVFDQIEYEVKNGNNVYCIYCTTGVSAELDSSNRNMESSQVLMRLGVSRERILFAGDKLSIADKSLVLRHISLIIWLQEWKSIHKALRTVYIPAWEGGHPDHDALHAVALRVFVKPKESRIQMWQFPLYNAKSRRWGFFRVLSPLSENGIVFSRKISWSSRLNQILMLLDYRSQWKSWLGLFPFFAWHNFFIGTQYFQPVSVLRLRERPHPGRLYYEQRRFFRWEDLKPLASSLADELTDEATKLADA